MPFAKSWNSRYLETSKVCWLGLPELLHLKKTHGARSRKVSAVQKTPFAYRNQTPRFHHRCLLDQRTPKRDFGGKARTKQQPLLHTKEKKSRLSSKAWR